MDTITIKYNGVELICYAGTILKYRNGKLPLDKVLVTTDFYRNASKANRLKESEVSLAFPGLSQLEIQHEIISKGDYNMNTSERREATDQKRRAIINFIHENFVDPKTKKSHPVARVELALDQVKPRIDPNVPAKRQAEALLSKIRNVLPLSKAEGIEITISVAQKLSGQVRGPIGRYATYLTEENQIGKVLIKVSVTPTMYDTLLSALNGATKGEYTIV